jgi:hypothetical protein
MYEKKYNLDEDRRYVITETLVSEDKTKYICLQKQIQRVNRVYTGFTVVNGIIQPELTLDITRVIRANRILKMFPDVVLMNSNGIRVIIDCISKLISFGSEDNLCGVLQYTYDPKTMQYIITSIFHEVSIASNISIVETNLESELLFRTLKVFGIILERGGIITINDGIEKIIHIPLLDPKFGYIGECEDQTLFFSRLNLIRKIWPELQLVMIVKKSTIKIYSEILKYEYNSENPCIVKVHRNHGSGDMILSPTHVCQQL